MVKLHKVEFFMVDIDSKIDIDCFKENLIWQFKDIYGGFHYEHNGEITVKLMGSKIRSVDIGEWHDDHKFNLMSTPLEEYEKEFE